MEEMEELNLVSGVLNVNRGTLRILCPECVKYQVVSLDNLMRDEVTFPCGHRFRIAKRTMVLEAQSLSMVKGET